MTPELVALLVIDNLSALCGLGFEKTLHDELGERARWHRREQAKAWLRLEGQALSPDSCEKILQLEPGTILRWAHELEAARRARRAALRAWWDARHVEELGSRWLARTGVTL